MHDDGAGEVVELRAELRFEEALLQAEVAVPDDALEERIEQADDQRRRRRTAARTWRARRCRRR